MISNAKIQNYKFVDPTKSYNFHIENISIWHHIRKIWFFQDDKCLYVINTMLKLYIIFLSILMISNEKIKNYKFVDPTESYNFHIESISIWHHIRNIWFFQDDKRSYAINTMLKLYIIFFKHLNDLKWKNPKL